MLSKYLLNPSARSFEGLGLELPILRNLYDYPRAYFCFSDTTTNYPFGKEVWGKPVTPKVGEVTDLELDRYHSRLLRSDDPVENLLGTASVIFWGYYTFSKNYALERVRRHLFGYQGKQATTPEGISEVLKLVQGHHDLGKQLGQLANVSQLSRTPFASKVIGFMFPDESGIYDNQIANGLARTGLDVVIGVDGGIGSISSKTTQEKYRKWCDCIKGIAHQLNAGIDSGKPWEWKDKSGLQKVWRSIDVERALFQYFKTKTDVHT